MTLPHERTRSIQGTREFLLSLLDPKKTPKVPRYIRVRAANLLKHYPCEFDMGMAVEMCPKVFGDKHEWDVK